MTPQGGRSQETPRGGADEAPRVEENMVLDFLQQLGTKMDAITSRVTRVEKRTARANAKRKLRRMKMSQNPRRNAIPPRRLINDFDEEADQGEEVVPEEEPPEWDEIPPKKKKRDATARRRAPANSAPSEARTTSVLDRMGRRLTEHDLRMKLDRIHAHNNERRPPPPPNNRESPPRRPRDRERLPPQERRNERTPPREGRGERVPLREPRVEDETQSRNNRRRNTQDSPPLSRPI